MAVILFFRNRVGGGTPLRPLTPYCVSRLIQILRRCYRFYIYCKRPKINTFQKGRCTHAWAAIVLLVGFASLSIFHSVKFNDNPFLSKAIVIFCTHKIFISLTQPSRTTRICIMYFSIPEIVTLCYPLPFRMECDS